MIGERRRGIVILTIEKNSWNIVFLRNAIILYLSIHFTRRRRYFKQKLKVYYNAIPIMYYSWMVVEDGVGEVSVDLDASSLI